MGKRLTKEEFIRRANEAHENKYDYSNVEFKKTADYIVIICPIHGEFRQQVGEHLRGRGCKKCAKQALCKSMEYYIPIFKKLHGDKYDYSEAEYNGSHTKIKVKCNLCKSVFYITPDNLLQGKGCKYCKLGENRRIIQLDGEIWKDISGYKGLYMVSNFGRVKSLPKQSNNKRYITEEKILSPRVCGSQREYLSVALVSNNGTKQYKIHRLVADAFIPNPNGYKEINHKDENKGNNCVDNLEWCTRSYNINYGTGIAKRKQGVIKGVAAYDVFGNIIEEFNSIVEASAFAKVDASNISRACRKVSRMSGDYFWRYKNIGK